MLLDVQELARIVRVNGQERSLFEGVSLRIAAGETLGLSGPSGSGKTQLLRTIVGAEGRSHGSIRSSLVERPEEDWPRFRSHVLFIPTDLAPHAASLEEICDRARCYRSQRLRSNFGSLLEEGQRVGLDARACQTPFSAGSQSDRLRAWLALAGTLRPEVLLMDDPTVGSPRDLRSLLITWIREEMLRGRAIVLASKDELLLAAVAQRLLVLYDGRVLAEGTPDAIIPSAAREARRLHPC